MQGMIDAVTAAAAAHPAWAAGLVFLAAAAESLAIIGAIVPGTAIIIAVGALVALGHLNLWAILAATAAGAVLGDGLSYWIGHRYRDRLRGIWPFSRRPELLERGEAFFLRRGASSILIARFVPVIRSTVPIAAGMLGMGAGRFYAANIGSALVWAPAHVLPGVLAGTALAGAGAISLRLGIAIAALLALLLATLWVLRVAALSGHRWIGHGRAALADWAAPRQDLAGRLGRLAAAPDHAGTRTSALLTAFCLLAFLALLASVVGREAIVGVDAAVLALVGSLHTQRTDAAMLAATRLGDTAMNLAAGGAMVGWLLIRRQFRLAAGVLIAIAATAAPKIQALPCWTVVTWVASVAHMMSGAAVMIWR